MDKLFFIVLLIPWLIKPTNWLVKMVDNCG